MLINDMAEKGIELGQYQITELMSQPSRSVVRKPFSTCQSLHTTFLGLICSTPFGSLDLDRQIKYMYFIFRLRNSSSHIQKQIYERA